MKKSITDIHRLSKGIFLKITSNFLTIILGLLISVLLNRYYGKEAYGALVIVFTVTGLFFSFCNLGSIPTLNRFLPKYVKSNSNDSVSFLLTTAIIFQSLGLFIFGTILFFLSNYIAIIFFKRPEIAFLLKTSTLYFIGLGIIEFIFGFFRALQDWLKEFFLQIVYLILYLFFICTCIFILKTNKIEFVLYANFTAAMITIFIGSCLIPRNLLRNILDNLQLSKLKEGSKIIIHFGFPLMLSSLNFYLLIWADKAILGRYITPSNLTLYYIGFIFYNAIVTLFKSLFTVFMPYVAEFPTMDQEFLTKKFRIILKGFLYTAILCSIIAFFWGEPLIITLYGRDYMPSVNIFRFLLIVMIIRSIFNATGMFAQNVFNLTKQTAVLGTILVFFSIIFNLILIPLLGYYGPILASIIAYIIYFLLYIFSLQKIHNIFSFHLLLKPITLLSALFAFYFIFSPLHHINKFIMGIIMVGIYVVLMKIFNEITIEDTRLGKEILKTFKLQGISFVKNNIYK